MRSRSHRIACLVAIICLGILSRSIQTGWAIFDKYLGDALYAAMVYLFVRLIWPQPPWRTAIASMAIMIVIEIFQLTAIPANLLASDHLAIRICARLLGTEFAFGDLFAYAVGMFGVYLSDRHE